ncbi:hypothetical protein FIBSPDRAFT_891413 [Athelia psychrophila]|uniref:Thioester reductase (TE) domain-containing protein n=1 Tax=Athelia psychrophila TaxID=1759441 RepID=A0A166JMH0_9AGAM|nr:hypothetical protein FIBSPDRAFT_891413 [Fibularhizoctonia sp. CBS 109695]
MTSQDRGSGKAKYVCERVHILENLLLSAADTCLPSKSGLYTTYFRIGRISGGKRSGTWATSDWVPSFVKSSLALGVLPNAHGVASWLPMDVVSQAVLDVAVSEQPPRIALNIVHPRLSHSFQGMVRVIREAIQRGSADEIAKIPHDPSHTIHSNIATSGSWLGGIQRAKTMQVILHLYLIHRIDGYVFDSVFWLNVFSAKN